jgi:hypothetical protein
MPARPKIPSLYEREMPGEFVARTIVPTTKPGYLIAIAWASGVLRYSTRGNQDWNGFTWVSSPWRYRDGALEIPGGEQHYATMIVGNGGGDIPVTVWMFYGDTPADDNIATIFDGWADGASELVENISMPLFAASAAGLFSPRLRITPQNGFSVLPPQGSKIQWGSATIELIPDWKK